MLKMDMNYSRLFFARYVANALYVGGHCDFNAKGKQLGGQIRPTHFFRSPGPT